MAAAQPAREYIAAALRRLRHDSPLLQCWPADLDVAMADPLRAKLITGMARALERRAAIGPAPAPQRPERPQRRRLPSLTFDPRRAAANDHDD